MTPRLSALTRVLPRGRRHCGACSGEGTIPGSFAFGRERHCTCAAVPGKIPQMTLHAAACDSVPCPFCQLLRDGWTKTRS